MILKKVIKMIYGLNAIILDIDEVRKIVEAIDMHWDKKYITKLSDNGLLDTVSKLRDFVRNVEIEDSD